MRGSTAVVLSATLVLAGSSFSTDASAFFGGRTARACAAAVKERCGHVQPRVAPLRACFETHMDHLSGPCASRLTQVANVAQECEADVRRLCGGVRRAADVQACMQPRLGEVSGACRRALARVAVPVSLFR
ncbi:MAG: hypothetical protein JO136_19230 [Hyphomicrobiales bacterium]|jgi:hypothetical protein|nr:hypothetical protein [Hyphomicrobiales bacterium]MBV9910797.1 hypothetical protein [Hyphomicrobiales bacterium]